MKNANQKRNFSLIRTIKKLFLSAFVTVTFILYALHKPASSSTANAGASVPPSGSQPSEIVPPTAPQTAITSTAVPQPGFAQDSGENGTVNAFPTAVPPTTAPPTAVPPAPSVANQSGQYKNGTFTGPEIDVQYGLIQVQVTIQNGKIASVQVPEYPNDRRTSVRINTIAVPYLQQEAIQAQSANVDLITGATLTSEGFQMSLQAALNQAKGSL